MFAGSPRHLVTSKETACYCDMLTESVSHVTGASINTAAGLKAPLMHGPTSHTLWHQLPLSKCVRCSFGRHSVPSTRVSYSNSFFSSTADASCYRRSSLKDTLSLPFRLLALYPHALAAVGVSSFM